MADQHISFQVQDIGDRAAWIENLDSLGVLDRGERERIPWRAITDVTAWDLVGGSRLYWASGSGQQRTIVWDDGPPDVTHVSNVGEMLVSGEQLAAIVARRSGVPLTIREMA